jgi:hypothetical protein
MRNILFMLFMLDLTTREWIEFDLRSSKTIPIWMQNRRTRAIFIVTRPNHASGKTVLEKRQFRARRYKDR